MSEARSPPPCDTSGPAPGSEFGKWPRCCAGSWWSSYGVRAAGIAERLMGVVLGSA
ncbi:MULTISPECIES: hypothetical protein [Streptomyces]|uniref:hypothetical protein n=1 Tax=Streptomyces TaxID=1883 RepID=UPI0013922E99|nr:hypothetical protein [Streptomyces noursei]UWS76842.1 hypothetical protein N1H47_39715 [Streptomyces noursei]